jgi:hypothetical protein
MKQMETLSMAAMKKDIQIIRSSIRDWQLENLQFREAEMRLPVYSLSHFQRMNEIKELP